MSKIWVVEHKYKSRWRLAGLDVICSIDKTELKEKVDRLQEVWPNDKYRIAEYRRSEE